MMSMPAVTQSRVVSTNSKTLPLRAVALRSTAGAGLARITLEQRFDNPNAEPLHVTYTFPLPEGAAVSGFLFRVGERTIVGEIDRKQAARERFEEAVLAGQTAALLDQARTSLFSQELGNVPAGESVTVEIAIDLKLTWLAEGMWQWRFPLAAAPRYLGGAERVVDAAKVAFDVAEAAPVRASLALHVTDAVAGGRSPESPSHPLACTPDGGGFRVELGGKNAASLDRDVVVEWPVSCAKIGVACEVAGPRDGLTDAHALVTIVPPDTHALTAKHPRNVTFLLDTSGSMGGSPIEQAKRVTLAMLDGLGDDDAFELIEFSHSPRRWKKGLTRATVQEKATAGAWLRSLAASGGTEMREGILEALKPVAHRKGRSISQQVVLVTDGLIGFEQEIIESILSLLPGGARLHAVGVGSAVNRSLTGPAARAGRGIEVILGLSDDPERAAERLRKRSDAPLVVDVEASGSALVLTAPLKLPDLYAGAPVLLSAKVLAQGGELVLRGKAVDGVWEERVRIPKSVLGEGSDAVVALFGREAVEDAEMKIAAGQSKSHLDASIEALGLAYGLSTRLTSWVAIDPNASVDPREPTRRANVPQALAHGLSAEGLGLRPAMSHAPLAASTMLGSGAADGYGGAAPPERARFSRIARAPAAMGMPRPAPAAPPPPQAGAPAPSAERAAAEGSGRAEAKAESAPDELAAPKKKGARSLLGRVKDALFRGEGDGGRSIALIGRVVRKAGREVTIEITLTEGLEWSIDRALVFFSDGGSSPSSVVEAKSTRSGSYPAGTTLRLTLEIATTWDLDTIVAAELVTPSGRIEITTEH